MRYVQSDHESALRIDLALANIERDRDAFAFGIDREGYGNGKRPRRTPGLRHAVGFCADGGGADGDPSPLWLMARYSHTRCDLITRYGERWSVPEGEK